MSESKGLGDSIEKITEATKIKALIDAYNKRYGIKDCGCKKRKDKLNEKFPYKNPKNEDV
tara:strand:+ start:105 stop:284 length:180 start_codon:yes stop_codon:yes gene_type:complete